VLSRTDRLAVLRGRSAELKDRVAITDRSSKRRAKNRHWKDTGPKGMWLKRRKGEISGGINNPDIGLGMGATMARQMFPPSGKTPARRLAVELPLGSLAGPGTWAEPEVEGVSRPGRFDPFPGLLLWPSHLWQGIGSFPLAGRGPTQRVPGCHQGWLSLFEASRP
jgi:hypothetical protein